MNVNKIPHWQCDFSFIFLWKLKLIADVHVKLLKLMKRCLLGRRRTFIRQQCKTILSPEKHINRTFRELMDCWSSWRLFLTTWMRIMSTTLVVIMTQPRLEYAAVVWSQHMKKEKHKNKSQKVQKVAKRITQSLRRPMKRSQSCGHYWKGGRKL